MPHRLRYRLPASSGGSGGIFFWLFALLVIGIIAAVLWTSRTPNPKPPSQPRPPVVATKPAHPRAALDSSHPSAKGGESRGSSRQSAAAVDEDAKQIPDQIPAPQLAPRAGGERVTGVAPKAIPAEPAPPVGFPRPPRDSLETQIALARLAISSGSIDGVNGSQTRAALLAFQRENGLSPTGELDAATRTALSLDSPSLTTYVVTSNDLARLQPISKTWLGKSQQTALDYETLLELVAEQSHASPTLTRKLNPGVNWTNLVAGAEVKIPAVEYPAPKTKAAFVVISLAERRLQAFDENTNLLAHFPCSIAAKFEKRPVGELHVKAIAPNPNYTFDPEVFPESDEARQLKTKLVLPPGPNNPVGAAWISLDRPGYGMHGTPNPEQVGRTESHGCFRLANWNAEYLVKLVWVGMPVLVEP